MEKESRCEDCFFYKNFSQPDYMENGETPNCCEEYRDGIPQEIWEEKNTCEEFLKDLLRDNEE